MTAGQSWARAGGRDRYTLRVWSVFRSHTLVRSVCDRTGQDFGTARPQTCRIKLIQSLDGNRYRITQA